MDPDEYAPCDGMAPTDLLKEGAGPRCSADAVPIAHGDVGARPTVVAAEGRLLQVASALEGRSPWSSRRPSVNAAGAPS